MIEGIPHPWDLSPKEAIALQKRLVSQVDTSSPLRLENIKLVAGVDVSVKNNVSRAAVVVMSYPDLEIVDSVTARMPTPFPYISGLLSFREGEVILEAQAKLTTLPDVYIFDGAGIAHPRRIGIATHIGLWWDQPTVGCAKTRLTGHHEPLDDEKGNMQPLIDKADTVGCVIRTRTNVKPVYVSVGHQATLETASTLILNCTTRYRLPEPIRAAHNMAGDFEP